MGAVMGIAIALLLALLPGGNAQGSRLQSAFSATTADQCLPLAADRAGEARRNLHKARGPHARRPDFDDGLAFVAAAPQLCGVATADASPRSAPARAQRPGRWPSTARAREPPLA